MKKDPYKKGTKPPKDPNELTPESWLDDLAAKMDYGKGVSREEAIKRINELTLILEENRKNKDKLSS